MTPTQPHSAIVTKLATLKDGEQAISARRNLLHRRIDRLYLSAPLGAEDVRLLDMLEGQEREVSEERRTLHAQINALRAQVGLPRSRDLGGTASPELSNVLAFPDVA